MRKYIVYKHTAPNQKVYIGITCKNPIYRWNNGKGYIQNNHFYKAILKYGWDNIKHEILFTGLTKEQACKKEIELIALYNSNQSKYGYNHSMGGESGSLGVKRTEETRKKMSQARKGIKLSAETKRKLSDINKGKQPWNKGKHLSEEYRKKLSEAKKGKHLGGAKKGKTSNRKGVHLTEETKIKMSEAHKNGKQCKAIVCIETGQIFKSGVEASKVLGLSRSGICYVLKGLYKQVGGYSFIYLNRGVNV